MHSSIRSVCLLQEQDRQKKKQKIQSSIRLRGNIKYCDVTHK